MKNLVQVSAVLAMCLSVAACKTNAQYNTGVSNATAAGTASGYSSGQASGESNGVKASNLALALEKQYSATDSFEIVKFGKDNANYVVIHVTEGATRAFIAVDISNYVAGTTLGAYLTTNSAYFYLTDYGNGTYSCGAGCTQQGHGAATTTMTFEKTAGESKDLDKAAALAEAYNVEAMASNLASQFGLSDDRSIKVAQLAASWSKLAKTRALTDADADAFSQELTGVSMADMNAAEQAMNDGNNAPLNAVLVKAADVNGTTSENMSAIMMKLFF